MNTENVFSVKEKLLIIDIDTQLKALKRNEDYYQDKKETEAGAIARLGNIRQELIVIEADIDRIKSKLNESKRELKESLGIPIEVTPETPSVSFDNDVLNLLPQDQLDAIEARSK